MERGVVPYLAFKSGLHVFHVVVRCRKCITDKSWTDTTSSLMTFKVVSHRCYLWSAKHAGYHFTCIFRSYCHVLLFLCATKLVFQVVRATTQMAALGGAISHSLVDSKSRKPIKKNTLNVMSNQQITREEAKRAKSPLKIF